MPWFTNSNESLTREQRDWVHRIANVLDKLPKRLQARAKEALREIRESPTRDAAEEEMDRFEAEYGAKYPKAVTSLRRNQDKLLAFCDFPAEHWKHIRTTNPIRCGDCGQERLLAFSCKGRGVCPSCNARRMVIEENGVASVAAVAKTTPKRILIPGPEGVGQARENP